MADAKTETVRKTVTISIQTFGYLEKLAAQGIHGSEWSGVARTFIDEGIRAAIKNGFIKLADD